MRRAPAVLFAIVSALLAASCLVSIGDVDDDGPATGGSAGQAGQGGQAGTAASGGSTGGASGSSGGTTGGAAGAISAGAAGMDAGPSIPGLVGHWPFDDGTGTVAKDVTSHQNNGALPSTGVSWADNGLFGKALQFTDPADGVAVNTLSNTFFPEVGSLLVWVKADFLSPETFSRGIFDNYADTRNHLFVRRANNVTTMEIQCAFQPAGTYAWAEGVPVAPGAWQLVGVGWNVQAKQGFCYVHGNKQAGTFQGAWTPIDQSFEFGDGLVGMLDDARLYDHMLTDVELAALLAMGP